MRVDGKYKSYLYIELIETTCVTDLATPIDSQIVVMVLSFIVLTTKHGSEHFRCISGFYYVFISFSRLFQCSRNPVNLTVYTCQQSDVAHACQLSVQYIPPPGNI